MKLSELDEISMKPDAAKTCELCGTPVQIVGKTTNHYEPVERIQIGQYEIRKMRDSYWIAHESGEGMEVKADTLEAWLTQFYAENF